VGGQVTKALSNFTGISDVCQGGKGEEGGGLEERISKRGAHHEVSLKFSRG